MSALRPGYRQTEVGMIPEEWEVDDISAVGPIQTGPFGTMLKAAEYSDGEGVPLISVGEIHLEGIRLRPDTPTVDAHVVRRLPQFVMREGDILFGRKGGVERSAVVRFEQDGWFLGSDGLRLRPRDGYSSAFLGYQFQSDRIRHWLLENSVGTTMPSMNEAVLGRVQFARPPTENEQKAIAAALADVDELITALGALIAKRRDIRRGAMQELLTGSRRLPGFKGEWEKTALGKIGGFAKGRGVKKDQAASGDLPCIRYGELYTHHTDIIRAFNSHISRKVAATAFRLRVGDILFAGSGETKEEIGRCAALIDDVEAYAGGDIVILRPSTADPAFLGYLLNTPAIQTQKASKGQGDAVVHISASALASIELKVPPTADEQHTIAAVLSDMDAEIAALEGKLVKARNVRQGMMQVLLTGEVRLV